jgi:hypothetical protein
MRSIFDICRDSTANAKVRAEAFKSLGEMCTQIFREPSFSVEEMTSVCSEVVSVLSPGCFDSDASVRGMALNASGNLFQALCQPSLPLAMIDIHVLFGFTRQTLECMKASDDSPALVGNAIRTVSHAVGLLLYYESTCSHERVLKRSDWTPLLIQVLASLTKKVDAVLSLLAEQERSVLTWKQRSTIKKHAWGACNTLSSIFAHESIFEDDELKHTCDVAVAALFKCVLNAKQINEKVACRASAALRCVPSTLLSSGRQANDIPGCIIVCLSVLFGTGLKSIDKLSQELDLLLFHLLQSPSIGDIASVLASDAISRADIVALYEWMVVKSCSSRSFGIVSLAMQMPGVVVDVEIEQRFASRALVLQETTDEEL